jgi:hypothetical protein
MRTLHRGFHSHECFWLGSSPTQGACWDAIPAEKIHGGCGLMFSSRISGFDSSQLTMISLSKWPMLRKHRMASSFITAMCSPRMTSMKPVAVTKMSPRGAASSAKVVPEAFHRYEPYLHLHGDLQ